MKNFIDSLSYSKVDIVCHSMGGLVTSSLLLLPGMKEKIDTAITLGTPYEGSPNLLKAILTRKIMKPVLNEIILLSGMTKKVKRHLPGITQLAPTLSYASNVPQSIMYYEKITNKNDKKKNRELTRYENMDADKYKQICEDIFIQNPNYSNILSFQNSIYNGTLGIKNSFFGIGGNQKTLSTIVLQKQTATTTEYEETIVYDNYTANNSEINTSYSYKLICVDAVFEYQGDGTVPFLSANKINKLNASSLGGQRVKYFHETNHTKVAANETPVNWVIEIPKNGKSELGSSEIPKHQAHTDLRIACPVDVIISNSKQSLKNNLENMTLYSDFGEMHLLGENGEIKLSCLDVGNYKVQLQGTDKGTMDYSLRFFDGNNTVIETRDLYDVPITKDTLITTDTNIYEPTVLVDKKRSWEKHHATVTKNYKLTSKKTPQIEREDTLYCFFNRSINKRIILNSCHVIRYNKVII